MQPHACVLSLTVGVATLVSGDVVWVARCWQQAFGAGGVSFTGFAATQCGHSPADATQAVHRAGNGISMAKAAARMTAHRPRSARPKMRSAIAILSQKAGRGQRTHWTESAAWCLYAVRSARVQTATKGKSTPAGRRQCAGSSLRIADAPDFPVNCHQSSIRGVHCGNHRRRCTARPITASTIRITLPGSGTVYSSKAKSLENWPMIEGPSAGRPFTIGW